MLYLDEFVFPIGKESEIISRRMADNGGPHGYIDNAYPCGVLSKKEFSRIDFQPITILYGGNGSGKSTVMNIIAEKLKLKRVSPFNSSELFPYYLDECTFALSEEGCPDGAVPDKSRIITSDDIFDYMLSARDLNDLTRGKIEEVKEDWAKIKYGETVRMSGLADYEKLRLQVQARRKSLSRRKFVKKEAGEETRLSSNGETALDFFDLNLRCDALYLLDEPENSLSAEYQQSLAEFLFRAVRLRGCQLVISTHSPFMLAMPSAKIYDLDACPVDVKKWWKLKNVRAYYDFFKKNASLFDGD